MTSGQPPRPAERRQGRQAGGGFAETSFGEVHVHLQPPSAVGRRRGPVAAAQEPQARGKPREGAALGAAQRLPAPRWPRAAPCAPARHAQSPGALSSLPTGLRRLLASESPLQSRPPFLVSLPLLPLTLPAGIGFAEGSWNPSRPLPPPPRNWLLHLRGSWEPRFFYRQVDLWDA